ncbi:hypothetical protein GQX73_g8472 [Xylaria multiplex]|uniref:Homeobox domain-containing protein n=1 Tax=Xylaria multiplex TaxID=323545 RepID=A0A7C8IJJ9_9PEZI|nr:hypothetical protein GQX73_g8472 [Xylaria multiplex]
MTGQSDDAFLAATWTWEETIDPSLLDLSNPLRNNTEWDFGSKQPVPDPVSLAQPASGSLPPQSCDDQPGQAPEIDFATVNLNEVHPENGVEQPVAPCSHCRRYRLRCFVLQTTSHNPNPARSCSSCVALFQDCSLAEQAKRPACDFETPQPVIGRLHGIPDVEFDPLLHPLVQGEVLSNATYSTSNKRSHSRSVRKTQPLRDWLSTHIDHPYPSEEERARLVEQSGLSKTQVIDWFTNARRRQRLSSRSSRRVFRQGSPMPSPPFSSMSPLERWRRSPPDREPVSAAIIERAISESLDGAGDLDLAYAAGWNSLPSSTGGDLAADVSEPSFYQNSDSASSCYSLGSADSRSMFSSATHSAEGHGDNSARSNIVGTFSCITCGRVFKKKSDMRRHVASIHRTGRTRWVCANPIPAGLPNYVWRMNQTQPECALCGQPSPGEDHFQSHEFESCGKRPVEDRTFLRKDHLWQHLYKFHGCRKWDGWSGKLELLQLMSP